MSRISPAVRELARRLVQHEARGERTGPGSSRVFPVLEKLRPRLSNLMGTAGFRALVDRALALARAEVSWLRTVRVNDRGALDAADLPAAVTPAEFTEGRVVVVAHLLGLLAAFIGEPLTLRLVGEGWPGLSPAELESGYGDKHEKAH